MTGAAGPHSAFVPQLGGVVSDAVAPPGAARLDAATLSLLGALLSGDWAAAEDSDDRTQAQGSGVVAAYTQFHLERGLRSLEHQDRVAASSPRDGPPPHEPVAKTHKDAVDFKPVDWTGLYPPELPAGAVPEHVAIVMDGNGRWANGKGLTRIEGHKAGEAALLDVVAGAIQIGVKHLSVYAFSTENWKRSPEEVRFLMGFNRDVLHRRRDQLNDWGVRVRWAGRKPRLWRSVIDELQFAERLTARQPTSDADDVRQLRRPHRARGCRARHRRRGRGGQAEAVRHHARRRSSGTSTRTSCPTSTCSCASSGEQRTSNFLLWQSAYAEMVFLDTLWPDFSRVDLWQAVELYARRTRRFGGAIDAPSV